MSCSTEDDLRRLLFSPRSVAIVGQSDDASKAAGRPLKFLRRIGYAGRIYPVNPRRDTVLGERAWPALAALPEPPEHAYIVTPTEAAVGAVEPRRGRLAHAGHADGKRCLRREGFSARAHLRRLPQREHDRRADVAREGAWHGLCRLRFGRERGRSLARRNLRGDP